jgi:outer membrane protein W
MQRGLTRQYEPHKEKHMKSSMIAIAAAILSGPVFAQEVSTSPSPSNKTPADNALELTLGFGYTQGFGDIGSAQRTLGDLSSAGGELTLGVGYRINPYLMIGAYGSGAKYATGSFTSGADIWTATAGLQANYHFLPAADFDPWVGLGAGWRGQWISHGGTDSRLGWDIGKLTAGVDYRVTSEFAVSPYVGVGVTTFLTQELAGQQSFQNISSPSANVWLFGGIQGRFDLFGSGGPSMRLASN